MDLVLHLKTFTNSIDRHNKYPKGPAMSDRKLFVPFKLDCEQLLVDFCKTDIEKQWDRKSIKLLIHEFPDHIRKVLNAELISKNLPTFYGNFSTVRTKIQPGVIHCDWDIHVGLNIPIFGTQGSNMLWFDGDYTSFFEETQNTTIKVLKWKSEPKMIGELELLESHLMRVDVPHNVYPNPNSDRAILSIRFAGNPTWEEILERITPR